ncbi:MAG: menaquinone biosynthesis protein [Bacteroidota bacterium]
MKKIRVTAVSYLNTKPLLYGLLTSPLAEEIDLSLNIPSECARKLRDGEVDLALTPVAILPELPEWHLASDYCIGAEGAVQTVNIYGEVPITEMEEIYLDHHSRTSVALTQVLMKKLWQTEPRYLPATEGYIDDITERRGGVVIGDRTIGLEGRFPFVYDLSEAWHTLTGLPFVFAAWVSTKPLPEDFVIAFSAAMKNGIAAIPKLKLLLPSPHPDFDLAAYFTKYISYQLTADKRQALDQFLHYLAQFNISPQQSFPFSQPA